MIKVTRSSKDEPTTQRKLPKKHNPNNENKMPVNELHGFDNVCGFFGFRLFMVLEYHWTRCEDPTTFSKSVVYVVNQRWEGLFYL
jgi:hypothetical protein